MRSRKRRDDGMHHSELNRSRARFGRAREESGIVLALSIMLLAVVLVLTLVIATSAIQSNTSSNQQIYADQALATAEAGAQTAYHRLRAASLSGLTPSTSHCFTTVEAEEPNVSTGCPGTEGKVGGDAYTYYVEPLTTSNKKHCTGLPPAESTTADYCITSTATVNNITRRVQERVLGAPETYEAGIESLGKIKIQVKTKGEKLNGNIIANGEVEPGEATVTGTLRGSPLGNKYVCSGCVKEEKANTVNGGSTKPNVEERCAEGQCAADYEKAAETANNKADSPSKFKTEVGSGFTESARTVNASYVVGTEAKPVQLESGTYNFCEFSFQQETFFEVPNGSKVTIYFDSPERPGSLKCAKAGSFKATHSNGFCVKNPSKKPQNLKIDIWGDNPGKKAGELAEFGFTGEGVCQGRESLVADIYAPYSELKATNPVNFSGSLVTGAVSATNGFEMGAVAEGSGYELYAPSAWTICNRSVVGSATNPSSGCY